MDIKTNLAQNLSNHRKSLKLTQAELATKLNYSDKAVSKWERGEAVPELTVLKQLADFYGVTIDSLLTEPKPVIKPSVKNISKKRIATALWSACIIWLVAVLFYACAGIIIPSIENTWLAFIVAVPLTITLLLVLTSVWGKHWLNFIFSSLLVWTSILAIFLIVLCVLPTPPTRLWEMFLIGIPIQALLGFLFMYKKVK